MSRLRLPAGAGRQLLTSTAGTLVLNVCAFGLNLLTTLLLARILGQSGYGIYAYALALALLLTVPAVLGFNQLLVRDLSAYETRQQWGLARGLVVRSHQAVLVGSIAIAGLAAAACALIGSPGEQRTAVWIAFALVPLTAIATIRQAITQAFRRAVVGRVPETLIQPILLILLVVAVRAFLTPFSGSEAVGLYVVSAVVALVAGTVILARTLPAQLRAARAEHDDAAWARAAFGLLLLAGVWSTSGQLSLVILGAFKGADAVALYSIATKAAMAVSFLFGAANYTLAPAVARLHAAGDVVRLQALVTRAARAVTLLSLPVAVILVVAGQPLLSLFGVRAAEGRVVLAILVVGIFLNVATGPVSQTLIMVGRQRDVTWTLAAGTALDVAGCIALIPTWGVQGAAVADATTMVVTNAVMVWLLLRSRGIYAPAFGRSLFGVRETPPASPVDVR
ncbi:MAG TPA: oligosaccharide flippase family protein [Candidatus Dormibacteraeota bacterium]|nr:oligosaccharide flippase family protein [Candidatus Dormibacteraeota bacterium]